MTYGSVCSGIESATVAWHSLGWRPAFFAEIDPFPRAVLAHHYPDVPNWGDMTKYQEWPDATIDLLVGGTPCQSFSVAGLRKGLADPRGNLMLTFGAIAGRYRPTWLVWENVPGVLSSNGGGDFGAFLGMLAELGYGFAYRVLDAQHFGVPQRRRRVFVVGHLGDWRRAAAVLFERHSLSGHPAPSREARAGSPGGAPNGARVRREESGLMVSPTVTSKWAKGTGGPAGNECQNLVVETVAFNWQNGGGYGAANDGLGITENGVGPLDRSTVKAIAFDPTQITHPENRSDPQPGAPCHCLPASGREPHIAFQTRGTNIDTNGSVSGTLGTNADRASGGAPMAATGAAVRRLTPRECERLQGFPDDYSLVPFRRRPAKDRPRYRALGNAMAVPVMRWIGERVALVAALESGVCV